MPTPPTGEGSAFACAAENGHQPGMSLRDYFAGQALAGIMAASTDREIEWQRRHSWDAYSVADSMLAHGSN